MEKKKIHMIGNTHIDPVWLWEREEGMQEVKSSFLSALDRMDEFPDFIFTHSSISYLEWMKENCPEAFERIRQRVAEGRWEIVGGMWVEPDCNIPSGESLIRHFLYGKEFVEREFGKEVVAAYNVDSFGHGANLPAVCAGCGIRYYLMSRPGKSNLDVPPVFVWQSPSGASVLAERTGGEYMAWTRPALERNLAESLEAMLHYCRQHYLLYDFKTKYIGDDDDFLDRFDEYVKLEGVDLIVIPNKKKNIFSRLFKPSMAHKILFHSDTAMLVVPV